MSAKHALKRLAAVPFRVLPASARHRFVQLAIEGSRAGDPADALRQLLQIDEDVTGAINELALAYDGGVHAKHRLMRYHDFFVQRVKPGERVLDVGCGYGAVAYSVATRGGAIVTGLDMNPDNIEQAKTRFAHAGVAFLLGKAPEQVPLGPFDAVIASNVLEHIEDRIGFLTTIQRRATPGRWLIRVPMIDRDWLVALRQELGVRYFSDPTHVTEYTRESFEREMQTAGFAIRHLQINWGEIWAEVASCA